MEEEMVQKEKNNPQKEKEEIKTDNSSPNSDDFTQKIKEKPIEIKSLKQETKVIKKEEKPEIKKEPIAQKIEPKPSNQEKKELYSTKKVEPHHKSNHIKNDESIDFKKIKEKVKSFFKGLSSKEKQPSPKDDQIDFTKIITFTKNNQKWLIPLACILFAILLSSYLRLMPSSLPITNDWAANQVDNFYSSQIKQSINQQYPNLPPQNQEALIKRQLAEAKKQNKDQIENDINALSSQFKSQFQDENGDTYLLAIDPYLWYGQARNYLETGHLGDTTKDGEPHYTLRNGRQGKELSVQLNPYIGAYLHMILSIFGFSLMKSFFMLPVVLIALALIPAFFIGRKMAGNVGGFFAAVFLAINGPLLGRTPGGFADTDPYNILFPLLITWLFLEAYTTENKNTKLILSAVAGLCVGIYATAWVSGWWVPFLMMIGATIISALIKSGTIFVKNKYKYSKEILPPFKKHLMILGIFILFTGISVSLFKGLTTFTSVILRPFQFITLKEVGITSIWPNVLTTVAEFNEVQLSSIIGQMGGNLLFAIAIFGIISTVLFKKNKNRSWIYFIILTLWFFGTTYAFTKGIRFAILLSPAFALALGAALGNTYKKISDWLNKEIHLDKKLSKIIVLAIFATLLISPFSNAQSIAKNEIPSMNDAWYNTLTKIKNESPKESVITSWWDFGHWFAAIAQRPVTFDGGDQGERIHWVGKSLLTNKENESIGILRMLNCVQEDAPHKLDEFTKDSLKSTQILDEVIPIKDRNKAIKKYIELGLTQDQANIMIDYTHCNDLYENYYITSEDMIGKAGVWGHFGSWSFEKATMYQNVRKMEYNKAIDYLTKNFELTKDQADQYYQEIKSTKGDKWIAPWPGYHSGIRNCERTGKTLICQIPTQSGTINVNIDLTNMNASIENNPDLTINSLVYPTPNNVVEKTFNGKKLGLSIVLIPNGDEFRFVVADPLQVAGMFTRLFFLEGHGLKCFEKFDDVKQVTGARIINWKIDYSCSQNNLVYFKPEPEVKAAHILISTENRTDNEALSLINSIKENVTTKNFATFAKKYSDDPGSGNLGGELGYFKKGMMVKTFEDAAFSTDIGKISDPIKTQFGYHIIYIEDKRGFE